MLVGILYLAFQAFLIIFEDLHSFTPAQTGLAFLGIGVGMLLALASQPYWNTLFARQSVKHNGNPPPEVRLIVAKVGAILAPLGDFITFATSFLPF